MSGRLLHAVAVLAAAFLISFLLLHTLPGDPAGMRESAAVPVELLDRNRHALGLDDSLGEQLWRTASSYARGELGDSFGQHRPVRDILRETVPATALLGLAAMLISYGLGLPAVAVLLALPAGIRGRIDRAAVVLATLPRFWLGILLILVAHGTLGWLPASHAISPGGGGARDVLRHLVLPALTLGLPGAAIVARYVLASLEGVLASPFARAARAAGASRRDLITRHALPLSIAPVAALMALDLPVLVSGVVVVETVFAWPGLGHVVADAVLGSDYPLALAAAVLTAVVVVAGRLASDWVAAAADPRRRGSRPGAA